VSNKEIKVGDMVSLHDEALERCYYGIVIENLAHERVMVAWSVPDNKVTSMPRTVLRLLS
jgi:hypothetical protein